MRAAHGWWHIFDGNATFQGQEKGKSGIPQREGTRADASLVRHHKFHLYLEGPQVSWVLPTRIRFSKPCPTFLLPAQR